MTAARSLRGAMTTCSWSIRSEMLPVSSPRFNDMNQLTPVAQKLRRAPKPLRSLAILNERSAVPSLTSKSIIPPTSSASKTKSRISSAEKERLRRIARRTAVDPDGITTSAEIKTVGPALTDAWNTASARAVPVGEFGEEGIVKAKVKTPITIARQREIYLSNQVAGGRGLETPDQGTSYNPKEADHTRLIELAVEEEKAQLAREAAEEERIRVLGEVKNARRQHADGDEFEYAPGMKVGPGEIDEDDVSEDDDEDAAGPSKTKAQKRKTQAQRNKAKRLKEQARLDAIEKTHKRLVASIGGLKGVQANLEKREKQMAEAERLAKLAKKQRERMGLEGGEKVGKHRVVKPRVTVQLGEDLAESLRQVKPEGNLFRDRYLALQRKALVEPRVKQMCVKGIAGTDETLTAGTRGTSCARRSTRSTRTSGSSRLQEFSPLALLGASHNFRAFPVRPHFPQRHARLYMHNDTLNIYTLSGRGKKQTILFSRTETRLILVCPITRAI